MRLPVQVGSPQPVERAVRIKICGLTRANEAVSCIRAGADWVGLNFHPASPRFVAETVAREILAALPDRSQAIGLFVNRPAPEVARMADSLGLQAIQLHGCEPPDSLLILERFWIIRAFRLGCPADIVAMEDYLARSQILGRAPDAVLVDAQVPGLNGGSGVLIAEGLLDRIPHVSRLILAGGLTPENVTARVRRVQPWMVDVASGVESTPGRKDLGKVAAFVRAVRSPGPV